MGELKSRSRTEPSTTMPPNTKERVFEWNGIKAGDRCYIDGDRDGRYTFKYVDIHHKGPPSATVYGGPPGHAMFRTPGADRVLPASGQREASQEAGSEDQLVPTASDIQGRRKVLKWSRGDLSTRSGVGVPAIATLEAGKSPRDKDARGKVIASLIAGEAEAGVVVVDAPTIFDQVVTEKFGGVHPDELAALGIVDEDEDEEDY